MYKTITAQELKDRLDQNPETIILDVRGESAFSDWHIDHKHAHLVNIQTSKLKVNGPAAYPEIPTDRPVVVVCARGNASREASAILAENGYEPLNLDGGMQEWSEFYYPVTVTKSDDFELLQVIRPAKGCLSYMLVSNGEAIVVDPARHTDVYKDLAREKGAVVKHVLDTHCHADHVSGALALANATDARYWIDAGEMQSSPLEYQALKDGLEFEFGTSRLKVLSIPTPGHTPGSMSFMVNDAYLLSGDTVFVSGLGRPDLGGKAEEWARLLYETVENKLRHLGDNVLILPAHFSSASEITAAGYVGARFEEIRNTNELLQGVGETEFTEAVAGRAGQTPPNYETIVQINRGFATPTTEEIAELETGPNRCAVKHLA
ncbi:MBL fold metallo-hydrolase [Alicyclobacillus sp. ALC3]|uniref:MBL fold metallo-hydrolase n=1 Tax=Alicyclobacillus sp. ALC3 TaxID=2796143 RepID=UPI0023781A3D|nr:MBL fold metallo-hydrolase [Alicyclobacillus sp. ALC3]WDL98363.1 MBL fold metallo-hydrolase [Alicyclobacillus sp. ALC3]